MAKNNQVAEKQAVETKSEPVKKKRKFLGKFVLLLLLVIVGAYTYLWYQWQYTKPNVDILSLTESYDERIKALSAQVDQLTREVRQLQSNPTANQGESISEERFKSELDRIEHKLMSQLENIKISPLSANASDALKEAKLQQEILLAAGTMTIRDLAERGLNFAYEAEVMRVVAQGNEPAVKYVESLQKYATSGIKGKKMLIEEFNRIYPHLNYVSPEISPIKTDKTEVSEDKTLWQKICDAVLGWAKGLVTNEKKVEVPVLVQEEDRVYALVNEGNLAEALNVLKTDAVYEQKNIESLQQWKLQVQDYLEFEKSVSGLLMNSLANLHLKEMDH